MQSKYFLFLFILFIIFSNSISGQNESKVSMYNSIDINTSFGIGKFKGIDDIPRDNSVVVFSILTTNGVNIDRTTLGVGFGIQKWETDFLFPTSLNLKTLILDKENTPYILGCVGYTLGRRNKNFFGDKEDGSLFLAIGIGYQYKINERFLYAILKFNNQVMNSSTIRAVNPISPYSEKYNVNYQFLEITLGIEL